MAKDEDQVDEGAPAEAQDPPELAAPPTKRQRLQAIYDDLNRPHGDVNDRIAALQRAVGGLLALAIEGAPDE